MSEQRKKAEIRGFSELDYTANEAMNTLATNISYCGEDIKVIEFTSRYQHEGKSFVVMNLMRTFASFGKTVVMVDADLRRSNIISKYRVSFSEPKPAGLAQYLAGINSISDVIYETNIPGAYMVPVGRLVSNSLQLLKSERLKRLIDALAESADIVLIDTPPAGLIVDAVEIAKHCDGAIIVVDYEEGHKREIADVSNSLTRAGCDVLGAVINAVDMNSYSNKKYYYSGKYYRKYYGGSYGSYYKAREEDESKNGSKK